MSLALQIYALNKAGITVNMISSPSEEGKITVTFLFSSKENGLNVDDEHDKLRKEMLNLLHREIQVTGSVDEIDKLVLTELEVVVEERIPIATSIKAQWEELQKKPSKSKATTKAKPKKPTKEELRKKAREEADKATTDLPLFQSDRSASADKDKKEEVFEL